MTINCERVCKGGRRALKSGCLRLCRDHRLITSAAVSSQKAAPLFNLRHSSIEVEGDINVTIDYEHLCQRNDVFEEKSRTSKSLGMYESLYYFHFHFFIQEIVIRTHTQTRAHTPTLKECAK